MHKIKLNQYTVPMIGTLFIAGILSLFASKHPDGLERVAIDAGFMSKETEHWTMSLFPDYSIPSLADNWIANSIVGIIGVVIMFCFIWVLGKYLTKGSKAIGKT